MGKFRHFLQLSAYDTSMFSFPDENLSKYQWIYTNLGTCIAIVEFWFGIANGQIRQFLTAVSAGNTFIFSFQDNNLSKSHQIFTQLDMCINIVEILFGIAIGHISSIFDRAVSQ